MSDKNKQTTEELLCPIRHLMGIFSGKWKLPIVCILSGETPLRYSTIKRKLGDITNVMLAQSLKELEAAGVIHREQYNEVPPRVEYNLTEKGKNILPILAQLAGWAAEDMQEAASCGVLCNKCQSVS
ncbi:winged helix-turn-helix transcriptional regulator [Lacrimispora sp.]|uniref:winged helix-turn-helix transcriptional regulator n=1 Tax=Lacrimispora sp. TaxID=2719234 RepID=UPI002FD9DF67